MTEHAVLPVLLTGWDAAWERLDRRLAGLTDEEYLWAPVPGGWTVHRSADGWTADPNRPAPEPTPVPTIAWRVWHIATDCLATYLEG